MVEGRVEEGRVKGTKEEVRGGEDRVWTSVSILFKLWSGLGSGSGQGQKIQYNPKMLTLTLTLIFAP